MAMARRPTMARLVALARLTAPLTAPLTARSARVRRMAWPTRSPRFRSRAPGEDRSISLPAWGSRSVRARPSLRRGSRRPKEPSRLPRRDRRDGDELAGAAPSLTPSLAQGRKSPRGNPAQPRGTAPQVRGLPFAARVDDDGSGAASPVLSEWPLMGLRGWLIVNESPPMLHGPRVAAAPP